MEMRRSSEAYSYAGTSEFPDILRNPTVHNLVHKNLHWSLS
jgi:hypothetical protein